MPRPTSFTVRMYQVGFGDCFLLSLHYPRALEDGRIQRHMLIDFGSSRYAPHSPDVAGVAELIAGHTDGHLDVVLVSHRHKDHLSGFANQSAADSLDRLAPRLIVRPWADHPHAPTDATGPSDLDDDSRRFALAINRAQTFAAVLTRAFDGRRGLQGRLAGFAADQISNAKAVATLERWAAQADGSYVHAGSDPRINRYVPGITARVLGPPTVDQWPQVAGQRADDPEYWVTARTLLERQLGDRGVETALDEAADELREDATPAPPGPTRWLIDRLRDQHVASLQRIVRTLDDALNNTSVILLIDIGDQRLLFPGDAQIENWSYALTHPDVRRSWRRLLARVDLYKVGHHGSRNATPKSLYRLWADQSTRPLLALLSTLSGVHGETEATQVPRSSLVTALRQQMQLWSTEDLAGDRAFVTVHAQPDTRGFETRGG